MSVTPEFVKKELVKLEKKRHANETTRKEALEALDKAESIKLNLQQEEVALRTLAAGKIPKDARVTIAQQLAEALKVKYDESSIMGLITKYEKQDVVEPAKPVAPKPTPKAEKPDSADEDAPTEVPKKQRGRPALTPEQKAERAKQRAIAAQQAAAVPEVDESDVDMDDDMEDEFPDLDEYGDE